MSRPVVLYACIHNSGRSVAAQVLTQHYAGDAVEVRSAGSEPGAVVLQQQLGGDRPAGVLDARDEHLRTGHGALRSSGGTRTSSWTGTG